MTVLNWRTLHVLLMAALFILVALLIIVPTLAYSAMHTIWDDAYFFVRYAENYLHGAGAAWNVEGGPTYGLTSQLYFVWVTVAYSFLERNGVLTLLFSSHFWGGVTLILVIVTAAYASNRPSAGFVAALFAAALTLMNPQFYFHFSTGMDTTMAMAYVTLLLLTYLWAERSANAGRTIVAGLAGALGYLVRPDLMLFSVLFSFGLAWQSDWKRAAMRTFWALTTTTAVTFLILMGLWRYYGTPIPLPFYAKTGVVSLYDPIFRESYRFVPIRELASFFVQNTLPFAGIALGLPRFTQIKGVFRGALFAAVVFSSYYLLFVLQIMHDQARFYYPIYPILVIVAAVHVGLFVHAKLKAISHPSWMTNARQIFGDPAIRIFAVFLIAQIYIGAVSYARLWQRIHPLEAAQQRPSALTVLWDTYRTNNWSNYWWRLDLVTDLPAECTIAATEVGMPGILNPGKKIIDIAGLNDPVFAASGADPDLLLRYYRPEVIYLPHPDYSQWVAAIEEHPLFQTNYQYFPAQTTGATLGLALRRDSTCADLFTASLEVAK